VDIRARLIELTIRDFAIIESLHIEWASDFSVLTGETGAGKSIVIDALGAALGDRADSGWIRSGAERAFVEAIFAVPPSDPRLHAALAELGCGDDDILILARDIYSGRSVCRVNGRAVPAVAVQQLAEKLVDVHSQALHLSLLRTREHLEILDRYATLASERKAMAQAAASLRDVRRQMAELDDERRQGEREAMLLRHEVDEIDAAGIGMGEEDELQAARSRLRHAQRLQQLSAEAYGNLQGAEESVGAVGLLGDLVRKLDEIAALDPGFNSADVRLREFVDLVEDLSRDLRRYADAIEQDASALPEIEERLLTLADLKRKYGPTLDEVMAYRERAAARLDVVEHHEERLGELRALEAAHMREAENAAASLSRARAQAASRLEAAVGGELEELGMGGAGFVVSIEQRPDPDGICPDGGDERVAFDETGADRVEFLISPNPGEGARPLARIASGGELARLMLALKAALADVDQTPVLIFDELDQGVGGRMGHTIGEKLWRVSRLHQVLCITHLPQVAAYADAHYVAGKRPEDERTVATVDRLAAEDRVAELTAMLSGANAGDAARRNAEELLGRVGEWKGSAQAARLPAD
jgi:DNA repair protein RecN (Recombination protein N)